ncbi:MAG: Ig-like domain-containing protein [Limisphaerales bacterium]
MKTKRRTPFSFWGFLGTAAVGALAAFAADPAGPGLPQVKILATDPTALEGGSSAAFTILRDGGTNAALTVYYAISGTASNGVDYVRLTNSVTILSGRLAADVIVQPIDNGQIEKDKTVVLTLVTNATYRLGSPHTAEVTIIDNRFNDIPPTVNLISPTSGTVLPVRTNVTLIAEAADPDDPILRVLFFADAHALGSVTNPPYSLTWTNVPPGRHTLYALVKDALGETGISKMVKIRVTNAPPVVTLTRPTNGAFYHVPTNVVLTAEAHDPDGAILKVTFYANERFLHTTTDSPYTWTWTNVPPDHYRLTAKATDEFGTATESAAVSITVSNAPPVVTLTTPTNGAVFHGPTNILLTATASDTDDAIRSVSFYADGRRLHTITNAPYAWTWTNVPPGSHRFVARATDVFGATAESAAVTIAVNNAPPVVALASPTNGAVFHTPPSIALTATASDPDDAIRQVSFIGDGHLLHSVTNAPYTWTWTNAAVGAHVLSATAEDQFGATAQSKSVTIRVVDLPPAVHWVTPTNGARIVLPAVVPLTVRITNDYGQIAKVSFYANDHLLGSVTNAPYSVLWTNPAAGGYVLEARAQDLYGGIGEAGVEVRVASNSPPSVGIVSPEDLTRFASRTNFVIFATASDQDGQVRQVEFFANGVSLGVRTNKTDGEYRLTWTGVPPADYTLTAVATDDLGASSTSPPVHLIYATAALAPRAQGSLRVWPDRHLVEMVNEGLFVNYTKDPTTGRRFGRAYVEFELPPLLANAISATLVLGRPDSSITNSLSLFLSFYPADLAINTNDLEDATVPLNIFPAASTVAQTLTFDVTGLVRTFAGTNLGFEIRFADDPGFSGGSRAGIMFNQPQLFLAFPSNQPPAVRITSPTNNAVFPANAKLPLSALAMDVDGQVRSVRFLTNGTILGGSAFLESPNTYAFVWQPVPPGSYALTAKAIDNLGLSTTSAPVQITVHAPPSAPAASGIPDAPTGTGSSPITTAISSFPVVEYVTTLPDGQVQLTITGPVGGRLAIEASPNFTDWTQLAVVTNTTGTVEYVDANASGSTRRFYRVKSGD